MNRQRRSGSRRGTQAGRLCPHATVLRGHDGPISCLVISSDGHWLITGSRDKTARLWNLTATDPSANPIILSGHDKEIDAVVISSDGRLLVTGSRDETARFELSFFFAGYELAQ